MLLGFKKQFAPKILDGSKKFTIRNPRKVEPKIGETMHMYTGLRTKYSEKISSEKKLTGIQLVDIFISKNKNAGWMDIKVDGKLLNERETLTFILADGFDSFMDFADFWIAERGENVTAMEKGKKKPVWVSSSVSVTDLIMYHWTDLRF